MNYTIRKKDFELNVVEFNAYIKNTSQNKSDGQDSPRRLNLKKWAGKSNKNISLRTEFLLSITKKLFN